VDAFLHKIEQAVDSALGSAENGIDRLMGASFHRFVELNRWLWDEFKRNTIIGVLLTAEVRALKSAYHHLRNLAHRALAFAESIPHRVRALEREWHGIEAKVRQLEHEIGKGIGHDLRITIKALEQYEEKLKSKIIPAIRTDIANAEGEISNLYE